MRRKISSAYLAYLESPEWWRKRGEALRRADYRCEREEVDGPPHLGRPLEVHHKTYVHLGCEYDDDLEVLCPSCHQAAGFPQNRHRRVLEMAGQTRLFDRWLDPPPADDMRRPVPVLKKAA